AFCPARTSFHSISFSPLYAFSTAPSNTFCAAFQISGPVPSPMMNGMTGLSGTVKLPLLVVIFSLAIINFLQIIYFRLVRIFFLSCKNFFPFDFFLAVVCFFNSAVQYFLCCVPDIRACAVSDDEWDDRFVWYSQITIVSCDFFASHN